MVEIELSGYPIVHVRWGSLPTEVALDEWLTALAELMDRGAPLVVVHDAREMRSVPGEVRRGMSEFLNQRDDDELDQLLQVVVHQSRLMRGVVTAVRWWVRNRAHIQEAADQREAELAAAEFLARFR